MNETAWRLQIHRALCLEVLVSSHSPGAVQAAWSCVLPIRQLCSPWGCEQGRQVTRVGPPRVTHLLPRVCSHLLKLGSIPRWCPQMEL